LGLLIAVGDLSAISNQQSILQGDNMEIVQIIGIIFAAAVILILAYLYRESAIIEGKTEIGIGPVKFKLGGKAQKEADTPEQPAAPPAPKIEQSAADEGRIEDSST
jgi:hypothetical protein